MSAKNSRISGFMWRFLCSILVIAAAVVYSVCTYIKKTYNVSLEEIINTFFLPTEGTGATVILDAMRFCVPFVFWLGGIIAAAICVIDVKLSGRKYKYLILWRTAVFLLCVINAAASLAYVDISYGLTDYLRMRNSSTTVYEEYYVDPMSADVTINDPKRNLIYIFIESMENTYADAQMGGAQEHNYIPNLTQLADENISFSNSDRLGGFLPSTGTGWTMAGLLACTSGVPFSFPLQGNKMEMEKLFGSGLHTMGDFLEKEGYANYFLCGSDAAFAGRDKYFEQHGNYEIFDYNTAIMEEDISSDYYVWWGYEDLKLYDIAKKKLLEISKNPEPFNFTLLTVDMHATSGYICSNCGDQYPEQLANVVACADRQAYDFIEWLKSQDFYKDTTIVITGDHLRMDKDLMPAANENYERTVYNCFINSAVQAQEDVMINRRFTAEDIFPTVLASIGYKIKDGRLGLGTDLFSGRQTLAEQLGINQLNVLLSAGSDYYIQHFSPELNVETGRDKYKNTDCITSINFCGPGYNLDQYDHSGISYAEDEYSWSDGYHTRIVIPTNSNAERLFVSLKVTQTYTDKPNYTLNCNGQAVLSGTAEYYGYLEFEAENTSNTLILEIDLPDAVSPSAYGSADERILSLAFYDLKIYEIISN